MVKTRVGRLNFQVHRIPPRQRMVYWVRVVYRDGDALAGVPLSAGTIQCTSLAGSDEESAGGGCAPSVDCADPGAGRLAWTRIQRLWRLQLFGVRRWCGRLRINVYHSRPKVIDAFRGMCWTWPMLNDG